MSLKLWEQDLQLEAEFSQVKHGWLQGAHVLSVLRYLLLAQVIHFPSVPQVIQVE